MARRDLFLALEKHAWLGRVFKRLKTDDVNLALQFIDKNDALSKGDFEFKINRMFLDKERPQRYKEIMELLTCANSCLGN